MKSLIDEIDEAFEGLEPPEDNELLHPDCMDDVDILEFYGGRRRQDMTDENIIYSYAAPTAFSPKAFRYYLPAYLIWTLKNRDTVEIAAETILLALDPGTERELLHDFRKSKFSLLTTQQIAVVKSFLWDMAKHPDLGEFADCALVNYWIEAG